MKSTLRALAYALLFGATERRPLPWRQVAALVLLAFVVAVGALLVMGNSVFALASYLPRLSR